MMIHQPLGGITGSSADIHIQAKEIIKLKRMLSEIIARHTGQSLEKVIKDSERDFYMGPDEAVAYGLIDEILLPAARTVKV